MISPRPLHIVGRNQAILKLKLQSSKHEVRLTMYTSGKSSCALKLYFKGIRLGIINVTEGTVFSLLCKLQPTCFLLADNTKYF